MDEERLRLIERTRQDRIVPLARASVSAVCVPMSMWRHCIGRCARFKTGVSLVNPASLFGESKRRRVFRALIGYGIAAFAVLQIIEPVMHGLRWPEDVLSYVVVALAVGFPIIVSLAWIFDVKAGRIERTGSAETSLRGVRLSLVLVGIGALAAAPGLIWNFFLRDRAPAQPAVAGTATPSIAVLPFVNMSRESGDEYFSDGITEEIINALTNVEGLHVASRTSAFAFKGKDVSVRKIGEELGVGTVLEGSVRRDGNALRIVAQLVSVGDGYHLWSKTYDRELKNIFAVEDELARSIAGALQLRLLRTQARPLVREATASVEAHDLYLRGRHFWNKRTADGLTRSIALFQRAVDLDPGYALAHVGLADAYGLLGEYGAIRAIEGDTKAKAHALKALEIDDSIAEAHASLSLVLDRNYDWASSERELKRAIELKPGYAMAHHWYATILDCQGRVDEGREQTRIGLQLDPTSLIINMSVGVTSYESREYDVAIEQLKQALDLDPAFPVTRHYLALVYAQKGRFADALAVLEKVTEPTPRYVGLRAYVLATSGDEATARRLLAELEQRSKNEYVQAGVLASIHMALGDADRAFAFLDKAYAERDWSLRELKVNPMWDPIRPDPRFGALLKRVNLE
ncbi:MAG: tetratricopeptide repeat protein [Deltaproteobacteria bacterium]|nr:MAG: tetratricopeptide repeat protein [Deltaproteobacteria bacterium]